MQHILETIPQRRVFLEGATSEKQSWMVQKHGNSCVLKAQDFSAHRHQQKKDTRFTWRFLPLGHYWFSVSTRREFVVISWNLCEKISHSTKACGLTLWGKLRSCLDVTELCKSASPFLPRWQQNPLGVVWLIRRGEGQRDVQRRAILRRHPDRLELPDVRRQIQNDPRATCQLPTQAQTR